MRPERVRRILERLADGELGVGAAAEMLARSPGGVTGGYARLDHHRALRLGHPEAVLCTGKSVEQTVEICQEFADRGDGFLATRASEEQLRALRATFPDAEVQSLGRIAHLPPEDPVEPRVRGRVLVVTAGTGDLPVAEEARVTARAHGNPVTLRADVGVAGVHRILELEEELRAASVVLVVAGMDAALASVVGGLVPTPVIAVPTSVGYGAARDGLTAMHGMLTSCAPGVTVVNVDNGYGAACAATRINQSPGGAGDGA